MTAIAFDRVTITLAGRTILSDVSLNIAEGEFVGVLGPNGAGKTTLMRATLGLFAPTAGSITVLGQPARRGNLNIGYLPQVRTLPTDLRLSGRAFVASSINGSRWGLPLQSAADRAALAAALDEVGATNLADRPRVRGKRHQRHAARPADPFCGRPGGAGRSPRRRGGGGSRAAANIRAFRW